MNKKEKNVLESVLNMDLFLFEDIQITDEPIETYVSLNSIDLA